MFKKIMLLLVFATGIQAVFAQEGYEAYKKELAQEACVCMEKQDIDAVKDIDQLSEIMGTCMLEAFLQDPTKMQKYLGDKLLDEKAMEKVGEEIGELMAVECPASLMKIGLMALEEEANKENGSEEKKKLPPPPPPPPAFEYNTKVVDIKKGPVTYLLVRNTSSGEMMKVFLLGSFNGSEIINNIDELKGNTYTMVMKKERIYNATDNIFESQYVLLSISK